MANLSDRFTVGQVLHTGEIVSHLAQDQRSGETIILHVVCGPGSEADRVLRSLADLREQLRPLVLEVGHEGDISYAITQNRPELYDLAAWANEKARRISENEDPLLKQRVWKIPQVDFAPIEKPGVQTGSWQGMVAGDSSFTAVFGLNAGVLTSASSAQLFPTVPGTSSVKTSVESADVTHAAEGFQSLANEPFGTGQTRVPNEVNPEAAVEPKKGAPDPGGDLVPGEFTQLFSAQPSVKAVPSTPKVPPVESLDRHRLTDENSFLSASPQSSGSTGQTVLPSPLVYRSNSSEVPPIKEMDPSVDTSTSFFSQHPHSPTLEGNTIFFKSGFSLKKRGPEVDDSVESTLLPYRSSSGGLLGATHVFENTPPLSKAESAVQGAKALPALAKRPAGAPEQLMSVSKPESSESHPFPFMFVLALVILFLLAVVLVLFFSLRS